MNTYRENPGGEENQRATKQAEREIFALQMQAQNELESKTETDGDEVVVRDDAQNQP